MKRSLRIVIAEDEPDFREYLERTLPLLGHLVVGVAANGRELVEMCRTLRPDLIVTDIKMPELDGIDATRLIFQEHPTPIILITAHADLELIDRAATDEILAYLIKPVKETDLEPAIALAMHQFERFQALLQETTDLRQALADRKVIERAKGILMKRAGTDEAEAYRRLQKLATSRRCKLIEMAQTLLAIEEATQASPD